MELRDSKTARNLMAAFAGECQAVMRYTMYAKKAKEDGYVQIQQVFEETAKNEQAHAKRLYRFLVEAMNEEDIHIEGEFPVALKGTLENLKYAAKGENHEHTEMYPEFSKIAKEEGFGEISGVFKEIGEVEEAHDERFTKLAKRVADGTMFESEEETYWICLNCGYIHKGKKAPKKCPACAHAQAYFKRFVEDY